MNEIIKVVIKGASGFCCEDEAYHDRLVITQAGMNYEYIPAVLLTSEDYLCDQQWGFRIDLISQNGGFLNEEYYSKENYTYYGINYMFSGNCSLFKRRQ